MTKVARTKNGDRLTTSLIGCNGTDLTPRNLHEEPIWSDGTNSNVSLFRIYGDRAAWTTNPGESRNGGKEQLTKTRTTVDILLRTECFPCVIKTHPIVGPPSITSAIDSIWNYCLIGRIGQIHLGICAKRKNWKCESFPRSTVVRSVTAGHIVDLPFHYSLLELRDSRTPTFKRFRILFSELTIIIWWKII